MTSHTYAVSDFLINSSKDCHTRLYVPKHCMTLRSYRLQNMARQGSNTINGTTWQYYTAISDITRPCTAIHCYTWQYMARHHDILTNTCIHTHTHRYIRLLDYTWLYMAIHGYLCLSMAIHGYTWLSMPIHGYTWLSLAIHGYT